jgi:formylglycine-generating enzyme required for sulfatase activity
MALWQEKPFSGGHQMKPKRMSILIPFVVVAVLCSCGLAACPSPDLTGDCFVDFNDFALLAIDWPATDYNDFALLAGQWLAPDPCIPHNMAYIPGGTFEMGDSFDEGTDHELPVHTVTLDSFYMAKHEISYGQYCDFLNWANGNGWITVNKLGDVYQAGSATRYVYCGTYPSSYPPFCRVAFYGGVFSVMMKSDRDMSNDPMVAVSWYGAVAYCNWRSEQEGRELGYDLSTWNCDFSKKGYRLATEAEWEYAARGGFAGRRFPWGDTITHSRANYYSSSSYSYDTSLTRGFHPTYAVGDGPYTAPVGSFSANGYGLYDMAGNVQEWCNDWYSGTYYSSSPTNNPTGPTTGTYPVIRGGTWPSNASFCRVALRNYGAPDARYYTLGFRCVLDLN